MSASARQHEIGRAWAAALQRPRTVRLALAAFDAEEERQELERESRGGNA